MIVFLNKKDLFAEKIKKKKISESPMFADFCGPDNDVESGVKYFLNKFLSKNRNPEREIYHHLTCATDTSNVKVVFDSCKEIVLRNTSCAEDSALS